MLECDLRKQQILCNEINEPLNCLKACFYRNSAND